MRPGLVRLLACVALASASCSLTSPNTREPTTTALLPGVVAAKAVAEPRLLPPTFLGLNGANFIRGGTPPADRDLLTAVATLGPPVLRVFGGTTANYWDWRNGWFVDDVSLPKDFAELPRDEISLGSWKLLLDTAQSSPVFDLNVVTSTLQEQLSMLREARRIGLAVTRVELGNELYQDMPAVIARYPTPEAYGIEANKWIAAIKEEFPTAQVAVVGALTQQGSRNTERKKEWNAAVLSSVRGADAMTFHLYFGARLNAGDLSSTKSVRDVLEGTQERLREFREKDLRVLPQGTKAWITEYNLFDRTAPVPGTWLHGLVVAQTTLSLVAEPRVDVAIMHALVGNPAFAALYGRDGTVDTEGFNVPATAGKAVPFGLTSVGSVMQLMFRASRDATTAQTLSFGSSEGGEKTPPLLGMIFEGGTAARLVLLNITDQTRPVSFTDLVPGTAPYSQISGQPATVVTESQSLERSTGTVSGSINLPPYSVTEIG